VSPLFGLYCNMFLLGRCSIVKRTDLISLQASGAATPLEVRDLVMLYDKDLEGWGYSQHARSIDLYTANIPSRPILAPYERNVS
jgi:hypothetical protein